MDLAEYREQHSRPSPSAMERAQAKAQHPQAALIQLLPRAPCLFSFVSYPGKSHSGSPDHYRMWALEDLSSFDYRMRLPKVGAEVGLASAVKVPEVDGLLHIPMIDFSRKAPEGEDPYHWAFRATLDCLQEAIPNSTFPDMLLYDSGAAYHAYWPTLLEERQWLAFMGALLCKDHLARKDGGQGWLDVGWVGGALRRGHSVLRWSANSPSKPQLPQRILQ